jgi:hypothetical protein
MVLAGGSRNNRGGRPSCGASADEVRRLRAEGLSWRRIGRTLGIGSATAMRLCRLASVPKASQNPQGCRLSDADGIQDHPFEEASIKELFPPSPSPGGRDAVQESAPPAQPTRRPSTSLEAQVQRFADLLVTEYADRIEQRPKAFKSRVLALIRLRLPPYPRLSGRPQQLRITRAAEMHANQRREVALGVRKQISSIPIAQCCIPGFDKIRSDYVRRAEIDRLRDAVYARRRNRDRRRRPNRQMN